MPTKDVRDDNVMESYEEWHAAELCGTACTARFDAASLGLDCAFCLLDIGCQQSGHEGRSFFSSFFLIGSFFGYTEVAYFRVPFPPLQSHVRMCMSASDLASMSRVM